MGRGEEGKSLFLHIVVLGRTIRLTDPLCNKYNNDVQSISCSFLTYIRPFTSTFSVQRRKECLSSLGEKWRLYKCLEIMDGKQLSEILWSLLQMRTLLHKRSTMIVK